MPRTPSLAKLAAGDAAAVKLRIVLRRVRPPIWRQVLVPAAITLDALHDVIQAAMGWTDSHLHEFRVGGRSYGAPDPDLPPGAQPDMADERQESLDRLIRRGVKTFGYVYDFGDDWEHEVIVQAVLPLDSAQALPMLLAGKRACPPEDCGGPWGYAQLLAMPADPAQDDDDDDDLLAWSAGPIDPARFDLAAAARDVAALGRRRAKRKRGG